MKQYSELTKAEQKQVQDDTTYTHEQLMTEDEILIPHKDFTEYAQELAIDAGMFNEEMNNWPYNCIDWEMAAQELELDYVEAEIDGTTYLMRAF